MKPLWFVCNGKYYKNKNRTNLPVTIDYFNFVILSVTLFCTITIEFEPFA